MNKVSGIKNIDELESVIKDDMEEIIVVSPINKRIIEMAQSEHLKGYKNIVDAFSYGSTSIVSWLMTKISNIGKTKEEKRWNNLELTIRAYYDIEIVDENHTRIIKQKDIY